ncbi:MAG: glycosyltransferase [Planctomycetota bacterium]
MKVLHVENSTGLGGSLKSLRQLLPAPSGVRSITLALERTWKDGSSSEFNQSTQNPLAIWRLIQRNNIDVLHINNAPIEAWAVLLAAAWEGIPVASHMRSVRPLRRIERCLQGALDALILLSDVHSRLLSTRVPKVVVRHPMDDPGYHPMPDDNVVGIFSLLKPGKGHDVALRALAGVKAPWKLKIVGGSLPDQTSTQPALESMAQQLGLGGRIEFLGHVENPLDLMKQCRVIIDLSEKAEGFRRTVAEACLLGRPVMASRCGGEGDILPPDQILPPHDVGAWTHALESMLAYPSEAVKRGRIARERALEILSPGNRGRFWNVLSALSCGKAP